MDFGLLEAAGGGEEGGGGKEECPWGLTPWTLKLWFSHAPPICGGRRGVVQYVALSGIDALSGAIKRKPSGPGLWQAEIHKKPHGPGCEVIR